MSELVSIVICTYNGENYLSKTIDSVLSQTYKNIEVVILDDGSTDGTMQILEAAQRMDSRIKVFSQENQGLAAARNNAFNQCSGEWLAIIDQDDLCYPERIEVQLDLSRKYPLADLIFSNTDYIDENDNIIQGHMSQFTLPYPVIKRIQAANLLLRYGCFIDSESVFLKKNAFKKYGNLDISLRYACDYEYFLRIGLGSDMAYTKKKLAAWRIHPDQATKNYKNIRKEMLRIYFDYFMNNSLSLYTRFIMVQKILKLAIREYLMPQVS